MVGGVPLKDRLARVERSKRIKAFLLVLPLLAFIVITFVIPIADMLYRSVDNPRLASLMPETMAALNEWDNQDLPDEQVFESLVKEVLALRASGDIGKVGSRVNYDMSGARSLFTKTARKMKNVKEGPYKAAAIKADKRWGQRETWAIIKLAGREITPAFYLAAVDHKLNADVEVVAQPGRTPDLRHLVHPHLLDQCGSDPDLSADGLSHRLPDRDATRAYQQPADHHGAAAVLEPHCWCARRLGSCCCRRRG